MSDNKKNKENHGHHDHCGHDHGHAHPHDHDHSTCGHNHAHAELPQQTRHFFSEKELKAFESDTIENLMLQADEYLTHEAFGKVVPVFEIALSKLTAALTEDAESLLDLINIKQNLAFSYGIIGEHAKAIPIWKEVILYKEKNECDYSDLLDDYFGIALSCEQCEMDDDFLTYIQKGLKVAKENHFEEYAASFEHELGGFYCDLSEFSKAENHLKNAISIREKLEDMIGLAMSKLYMGILFEEQKKYEEAKQFYENALKITKNEAYSSELIHERAELEQRLSQIQNINLKSKLLDI